MRLNLADITPGLPSWTLVNDVNNKGALLGVGGSSYFSLEHSFLLERE